MKTGDKVIISAEVLRVHGQRADVQLAGGHYVPQINISELKADYSDTKAIASAPSNKAVQSGQNK